VQVTTTIAETRARLDSARRKGQTVGLFPTMGYLHEGHASLMRQVRAECDVAMVSIFVNPLQFAAGEDLSTYPRDLDRDTALAESIGIDVVFAPDVDEMFPMPPVTSVSLRELAATMEGASRPSHFDGVATVVAKLFNIAGPCRAYFSEKDFQQLVIVTRMVADLSFPIQVVACPFVREADGLALSSRNVYLSADERAAAPILHRALLAGARAVADGERDPSVLVATVSGFVEAEPLAELDYVEVVESGTLRRPDQLRGEVRLLIAARFGRPRLLDNLAVLVPEQD
jgi:pantoate--beta-alanine ligase